MKTTLVASIAALALTSACTQELSSRNGDSAGYMRGDLGTVSDIDDGLHDAFMYSDGMNTHLEVHALGDYGWAMVGIDIWGAEFGSGPLAAGQTMTFYSDGRVEGDDQVGGTGIGCSGPDYGQFDYDEPSEQIGLSIDTDPETGGIIVDIIADFGDNGVVETSVPLNGVTMY